MERPAWAPEAIDIDRPSAARIYDYHLGGGHNFAVDREIAEKVAALMPELPLIMRANRAFLLRAVRLLLESGIRQFLDLGSGIPTVGNVHEIAQAADPAARVVYVDSDPVAVAHSQALLAGNDKAGVVHADLRDIRTVLAAPEVARLIDFSRPVGLLMVAVLHFVPDRDDPAGIVAAYRDAVPPGSYLVLSHGAASEETHAPAGSSEALAAYSRSVTETTLRTRAEVAAMFDGFEPVDPGVVYVTRWRPWPASDGGEPAPLAPLAQLAGVGRKP